MLQFLLILIISGYIFSRLAPYLLRYLLTRYVRKANDIHYQNHSQHDQNNKHENVKSRNSKRGKGFSGGEYIDFEEIK